MAGNGRSRASKGHPLDAFPVVFCHLTYKTPPNRWGLVRFFGPIEKSEAGRLANQPANRVHNFFPNVFLKIKWDGNL